MDLTLTKRGDYVLRAATVLANEWSRDGRYSKIRMISEDMGIPPSYTPQILGLLSRAGIAESKAGRYGGYRLRRNPYRSLPDEGWTVQVGPAALEGPSCAEAEPRKEHPPGLRPGRSVAGTALEAKLNVRTPAATGTGGRARRTALDRRRRRPRR